MKKKTTETRTYLDDVDDLIIALLTDKEPPEHAMGYKLVFVDGKGTFEIQQRVAGEPYIQKTRDAGEVIE